MTTSEKLTMLKSILQISGSDSDSLLGTYLDFSKKEIISWRYGSAPLPQIAQITDSEDLRVTILACLFIDKVSPTSGTSYVFTYSEDDESWQYASSDADLVEYGINYSDYYSPVDGETITVQYNEGYLAQFDTVQVMACVAGYGISGAENQASHSENGISRTFRYSDMVDYIHDHVPQYLGVV